MGIFQNLPGLIRGSQGIVGVAQRTTVTLTSAQILALFTTPITLIPAPGAGKTISIDELTATLSFNSIAYTGANALEVRYTNAAGAKLTGDVASALINAAATRVDKAVGVAVTGVQNAPVVAAVPTANPAAGNSTITFDILYRVVG